MIIPPSPTAAGSATAISDGPSPTSTSILPPAGSGDWNSLIGIVTAIVGNILISFALNMQRYAHIRLNREWEEKERQRKLRNGENRQVEIAEERAKKNTKEGRRGSRLRHVEYTVETEGDGNAVATEADPLIPSIAPSRHRNNRPSLDSTSSGSADDMEAKQKSYLKSYIWWVGIILMTIGEAGNFLAYGFAPASIVSPLGVVALISNCVIAPFMLKERFRKRDGLGVLVAVGGAVTVVASASDNNPKLGPDEIWDLIKRWEFETYLGITIAVIIALSFASNKFGEKSILIDLGLVGLLGGYTALSTKGVASMLSYTIFRALTFPITYILIAILISTAIMQIKYVNRALQRFDSTQVIPTQFVLFTLSVILGSAVLYRDFESMRGDDAGKFVGGCVMTFLGVWLITSGRSSRDEFEEDRDPEPPEAITLVDGERYRDSIDEESDHDLETGPSSRRSSTVRAASPPIPIRQDSGRRLSPPSTPTITLTPLDEPQRSPTFPSTADPDMMTNPWKAEDGATSSASPSPSPSSRPAPLQTQSLSKISTHSMPVLTSPSNPSTSNPIYASSPSRPHPDHPRTPTRGISDNAITTPVTPHAHQPSTPGRLSRQVTAERHGPAARNSIAGPLLASPLGSSLSAVVAELKRGGSLRGGEYVPSRRRQSLLVGEGVEDERGEGLQRTGSNVEGHGEGARPGRPGRGRSLSGTLGEFWRGFRGRGEGGGGGGEEGGDGE